MGGTGRAYNVRTKGDEMTTSKGMLHRCESCDHDFARDPQPTHHCDPQRVREKVLREALDAVPQDICTHDGCDKESTCPLTRVNVAISALLSPEKAK